MLTLHYVISSTLINVMPSMSSINHPLIHYAQKIMTIRKIVKNCSINYEMVKDLAKERRSFKVMSKSKMTMQLLSKNETYNASIPSFFSCCSTNCPLSSTPIAPQNNILVSLIPFNMRQVFRADPPRCTLMFRFLM